MEELKLVPEQRPRQVQRFVPVEYLTVEGVLEPTETFVASVKRWGVLEPLIVQKTDDALKVLDGTRRYKAAVKAGLSDVPVIIYEGLEHSSVVTLVANEQRSSNPVAELGAIRALVRAGANEADIAKATGMKLPTLRKRMRLLSLHDDLIPELEAGRLGVTVAERLARMPLRDQEAFVGQARVTHADVEASREAGASGMGVALEGLEVRGLDSDARLRAAAPAMLTALKAVLYDGQTDATLAMVRAAIQEATGE